MEKREPKSKIQNIINSKFIRSVFWQIILVFVIVIIAIVAIVFGSFTSEINNNIVREKQKQLELINDTISNRMKEATSIAYKIGTDKAFYLDNIKSDAGYEMSNILERFLVGNDFVEYLAYYPLAENDKWYSSRGKLTFNDFYESFLAFDDCTKEEYIEQIKTCTTSRLFPPHTDSKSGRSYFTYVSPLPQFSKNPQAFVIMLMPMEEFEQILVNQIANSYGRVALFDANGNEVYEISTVKDETAVSEFDLNDTAGKYIKTIAGNKYVLQSSVSESNSWKYVSLIRLNDIISQTIGKQIIFIACLIGLMMIAIFIILICVAIKYEPINNLAMSFGDGKNSLIDEMSVLSDGFASLKDDSDQKQKFEAAYLEAEAANQAKSAFLSNVSHDIRTPMNAIVGMTEIANKNIHNPDYVKECLKNVSIASQYLLDIINNVLDMSRIESGKFKLSEDVVDLSKIVSEISTILNHNFAVKSLNFKIEIENIVNERFIGDSIRLTQVFMNIISNSIKFTPNEGTVYLNMRQEPSTEEGYGDYVFTFSDTGIGISQDFIDKVFETFTRDDKVTNSKIEGTGLGMSIAKSFVELMGGTIKCESELNKGTTFTIRLHMKLADDENEEINYDKYKKMSVMIIGQDEEICQSQAKVFEALGAHVAYCFDVDDAIEELQQNGNCDFVVIDQSDKDFNGIVTVTKMKRKIDADIYYVLASKDISILRKSDAVDAGISAFVQIPLFRSTAIGILDKTIKRKDILDINDIINLEGKRVLLVEDNDVNRQIAHLLIEETKAEIVEACNGKEAVDKFKENPEGFFDVILMDIQMPIMNGYEATAAIRSVSRADAPNIPIFAMTANTFDEDVRQVRESGMNGHLSKPYESKELYRLLNRAINKK